MGGSVFPSEVVMNRARRAKIGRNLDLAGDNLARFRLVAPRRRYELKASKATIATAVDEMERRLAEILKGARPGRVDGFRVQKGRVVHDSRRLRRVGDAQFEFAPRT